MPPRSTQQQLERKQARDAGEPEVTPVLKSVGPGGPLSIKLPDEAAKAVRELAEDKGITATEVLKRGITLQRFITQQLDAGGTFMIQRPDGQLERVLFVFS